MFTPHIATVECRTKQLSLKQTFSQVPDSKHWKILSDVKILYVPKPFVFCFVTWALSFFFCLFPDTKWLSPTFFASSPKLDLKILTDFPLQESCLLKFGVDQISSWLKPNSGWSLPKNLTTCNAIKSGSWSCMSTVKDKKNDLGSSLFGMFDGKFCSKWVVVLQVSVFCNVLQVSVTFHQWMSDGCLTAK